jgi:hypothetical protein
MSVRLSVEPISTPWYPVPVERRFHESWMTIQSDLAAVGMTPIQILRLQNSCIRYIKARSVGEPGATSFSAAARDAKINHEAEVAACRTLPDIAERLRIWMPSNYEHQEGAYYVEAFEAIV